MLKSDTVIELIKALSIFQGKLTAVKKDATNPFYKSKYATLDTIWETIRKPLSENGLAVIQTLSLSSDGKMLLDTTLFHTSGEWISGSMVLNPVKDDPQGLGSAISYARRYSLCALLGIVADEDDDANATTKPKTKSEPPPKSETTTPASSEKGITPAQTSKIFALVKEKGITADRAKAYLKDVFHKMSTKELTISEASRLIEDINAGKLNLRVNGLVEEAKRLGAKEEE